MRLVKKGEKEDRSMKQRKGEGAGRVMGELLLAKWTLVIERRANEFKKPNSRDFGFLRLAPL